MACLIGSKGLVAGFGSASNNEQNWLFYLVGAEVVTLKDVSVAAMCKLHPIVPI